MRNQSPPPRKARRDHGGAVHHCFHHASMEDATVTKTKVDVTEATPICKGVKAEHMNLLTS